MTPALVHLSTVLATGCIAGLWQGAALALLASALLRFTPKASPALRHTLLIAIFIVTALLPWLPSLRRVTTSPTGSSPLQAAPWIASAIVMVWIAATAVRAIHLASAWLHLRRVRRNATPIVIAGSDSFPAGGRRALLCVSSEVDSPTILGFFRPVLLLPDWLAPKLSSNDLHQIALHECEHLRRRDDWVNLLLQFGLVLVPLNPALHWLNRSIGIQRELACDAEVVASTAEPLAYAASLTKLAEQRMHRRSLRLALAAWGRKSELTQRVYALLAQRPACTLWHTRAAGATGAVLLLTVSAGLAHAPQLVRFTNAPMSFATTQVPEITTVPAALAATMVKASATGTSTAVPMVPAVFPVKTPSRTRHRAANAHENSLRRISADAVRRAPQSDSAVRFVHTALANNLRQTNSAEPSTDDGVAPVRFVTTDFITPYVAVPVRNGWILIEL
ncbi:M56 family metallopeptidase [Terriglobus roseus]|uniref:Signal transducer regulating beta-lactamase production, contains metallopeptidase domain n=1 Tax=Terriglobus roseus TaxID=392734 RepID=A0A1H4T0H4_9BACT|nr:M56 family metallopeptidase [Terriglobus roseus]SEC49963.1 Signal transducer regulating beta-lactamase production, contains metallopeptidase domain [Terriglobus roseus]